MKNYKLKLTLMLAVMMSISTLTLTGCGKDDTEDSTTTPTVTPQPQVEPESKYIGMPMAEEIALQHANLTADTAENIASSMDLDDAESIKYIVDFDVQTTHYNYTIHAESGEVLDYVLTSENDDTQEVPEVSDYIGNEKAKEISYLDAGVTADDVEFCHAKLSMSEDDRAIYDVEFYIGSTEYDYEIDALTGDIISVDDNAELFDVSIPDDIILGDPIGEEAAITIARNDAKVESTSNLFVKLDTKDDKTPFYWVEFLANNTQFGYEIHSVTGEILFKSSETDENAIDGVIVDQNDTESPYIGEGKAVSTAVNHAGSDPNSEITVELVLTETKSMYHIGFSIDNTEYKYEIDAINGKIMSVDKQTRNYNNGIDPTNTDVSVIGDEAALDIALKSLGLDSATFIKVDFNYDNGVAVYKIDFRVEDAIYQFEIDAISGQILDYVKQ